MENSPPKPRFRFGLIAFLIAVVLASILATLAVVKHKNKGEKKQDNIVSQLTKKVTHQVADQEQEGVTPEWAESLADYKKTVEIANIPQNVPGQFSQNLLVYFPTDAYDPDHNCLQLGVILENNLPLMPEPRGSGMNLTPDTVALLKAGQAFWKVSSLTAEDMVVWDKLWTFEGDDGYISEIWRSIGLGMKIEDFLPHRVCLGADGSQLYTLDGEKSIYAAANTIFEVKKMYYGSLASTESSGTGSKVWFQIKGPSDEEDLLVRASDCWLLTEEVFYQLYLASKPVFLWPGLYKKPEEIDAGIARHKWFLASFPESPFVPQVLNDCAQLMLLSGDEADAKVLLTVLQDKYPNAKIEPSYFAVKKKEGEEKKGTEFAGSDQNPFENKPDLGEVLPRGTINQ
jgi:hypothetical protein